MVSDTESDGPELVDVIARLLREGAQTTAELARLLPPTRGRERSPGTLRGWIQHGKKGVKLEGFRGADGAWRSSAPALARFLARLTTPGLPPDHYVLPTSGQARRQRQQAIDALGRLWETTG